MRPDIWYNVHRETPAAHGGGKSASTVSSHQVVYKALTCTIIRADKIGLLIRHPGDSILDDFIPPLFTSPFAQSLFCTSPKPSESCGRKAEPIGFALYCLLLSPISFRPPLFSLLSHTSKYTEVHNDNWPFSYATGTFVR